MRTYCLFQASTLAAVLTCAATPSAAQQTDQESRQAVVEAAQAEKLKVLAPYSETGFERLTTRIQDILDYRTVTWHPYFQSAAHGSGLALGVGRVQHVTPYNYI